MTQIVLFHSVHGLRPGVLAAADRLRAAGHQVVTPDLYEAPAAGTAEEGFALLDKVGRETVLSRARAAAAELPPDTVLGGFSFGCWVAAELLAERPAAAALLLLHGVAGEPGAVRPGLPVQLHLADPDEFEPQEDVDAWQRAMIAAGADLTVHRYPGPGHIFTDPDLPDHDAAAAELAWERVLAFLADR